MKLKVYVNDNYIEIVGDMLIYVVEDLSDMWVNLYFFKIDVNGKVICIVGCLLDEFFVIG